MIGRWNPDHGDAVHRRTERLVAPGALCAWVRVLRDVLYVTLQLYMHGPEEAQRVLYRELTEPQFAEIRRCIQQIIAHPVWDTLETNDQDFARSATRALALLKKHGLIAEWVLQRTRSAA